MKQTVGATARLIFGAMPARAQNAFRIFRERRQLQRLAHVECSSPALRKDIARADLITYFESGTARQEWHNVTDQMNVLGSGGILGGVNPGDRRAIYHLTRHIAAASVLEVGTHIGASTAHIAVALKKNGAESEAVTPRLVTVDIVDVNDTRSRPWARYGSAHSPLEITRKLGVADFVSFVKRSSLEFLASTEDTFDLIFLDGSHSAATVYREVPAALRVLKPGGTILLHDYFPDCLPLWSNGSVIPGPFLAIERLKAEGAGLSVVPLGSLPWDTKQGSSVTSLALLRAA